MTKRWAAQFARLMAVGQRLVSLHLVMEHLAEVAHIHRLAYTLGMATEPVHRVLMKYMAGPRGWRVSFLEADCRTALPRKLAFAGPGKIRAMHERFGSQLGGDRNALEYGISIGRGGVCLTLTEEQHQKLNA